MPRFQILSLIGGGIRGAFITSFLKELEQKLGRPISECFDLIAGTSTGGIIAAGLALGQSAEQMHQFYVDYGAQIFTPRPKYRARGLMKFVFPTANWFFQKKTGGGLDAAFRARFCPHSLKAAFDEGFGESTLQDINNTRLIIPTVNLTKGKPHVFRSCHLPVAVHDQDLKITDVVIAATAAPTYFPHRRINGEDFVDGGIWNNDPSVLGFAEAMRIQQFECPTPNDFHFQSEDIHLLSVGTGRAQYSLSPPGADAGLIYWAPRVAEVMGMAQTEGIHQPLKFLLQDRYQHVNFKMNERWPLDAVENIPHLFRVGRERAIEAFDRIEERFFQHTRRPFSHVKTSAQEINVNEFEID